MPEELKTICFLTRVHPRRPTMLEVCRNSVLRQSSDDYQHLLVRDDTTEGGYGQLKAEECLAKPWPIEARYVMVLDDDNELTDLNFVKNFKSLIESVDPDIVFFKGYIEGMGIIPPKDYWGKPPQMNHIDYFNFAVKLWLWTTFRSRSFNRYAADFNFIRTCYRQTGKIIWHNRLVARTQKRPSKGKGEDE